MSSRRASRPVSRRRLVLGAASVGLLLGCDRGDRGDRGAPARSAARPGGAGAGGDGDATTTGGPGSGGDTGGGGGGGGDDTSELLEILPFVDDGDLPLETLLGVGWDGRLYTDLSKLGPDALLIDNDRFYVRTRTPDLLDPDAPWVVSVDGLVASEAALGLEELLPRSVDQGVHLLECSGNARGGSFGLLSAAAWRGVPMAEVLSLLAIRPEATRVLVSGFDGHSQPSANGHSKPGASWIFTFDELAQAFLATHMNGAPLPPDHGAPLRLLVPGWFGCTAIKWVDRITLVDDDALATSQMQEFASRTHQDGVPVRAADFRPARIQQAAMPVRVERRRGEDGTFLRVWGILWGGREPTSAVSIRFGGAAWQPVTVDPPTETNATWTLWRHDWRPTLAGEVPIRMRIDDPSIPTIRLDADYYLRTIAI